VEAKVVGLERVPAQPSVPVQVQRLFRIIEWGIFEEVAHDELLVAATQVPEEDGASAHVDANLEEITTYAEVRLPTVNRVENANVTEVQPSRNFIDAFEVGAKRRPGDAREVASERAVL
jgi:hypothetical protein